MTPRITKMRTLLKAGFVHVAGWVEKDDAPEVEKLIEAAKPKVEAALSGENK
jgi:hypothetical protein